jgi:hypothetical protein
MTAPAPDTRASDTRGDGDGFEAAMQRLAAARAAAAAEALRTEEQEQDELNYYCDTAAGREYEH